MGTIEQRKSVSGYCPVDKCNVPIGIGYYSFPQPDESKKNMTFMKSRNNYCSYLSNGKCQIKADECPIWQTAPTQIKLDVSDKRW